MIKHAWSLLAENAVVDQSSNVLSIQSVLERIKVDIQSAEVPKELVIPFKAQVISFLYKDDETTQDAARVTFTLNSPEGEMLMSFDQNVPFEKEKKNMRLLARLDSIKLKGSGIYHMDVSLDGELVQTSPLEVLLTPTLEA